MPTPSLDTYRFDPRASRPLNGIALVYDLQGFSRFFNQPDVQDYVPRFLNHISEAMGAIFSGGETYWCPEGVHEGPLMAPVHEKYLGDGALYIFTPDQESGQFPENFLIELCNRLWNLMNNYDAILRQCADFIPVFELPPRIRFGLARGTVYELTHESSGQNEYIGFCVNLAARLQGYCRNMGFLASARMNLPEELLQRNDFKKVVATQIPGFSKEIVIVDRLEYDRLESATREHLFEEIVP